MSPTYVFVHGASSNASTWAPLQRELALLGHRSLAVDLPGHGADAPFFASYQAPQNLEALASEISPLAKITLADSVNRVIDTVRKAAEHGPVILVGHSRAGLTLTGVGNSIPELLQRIVYVSAWCCVALTAGEYMQTPENASSALNEVSDLLIGNPAEVGAIRMNWRTADPKLLAQLKFALLADGTESEFLAYLNTLEPDEILDAGTAEDSVQAESWGRIPHTYIRLTGDESMPLALQDRFIKEADGLTPHNPFDVRSLDSGHVRWLLHPQETAIMLAELADR